MLFAKYTLQKQEKCKAKIDPKPPFLKTPHKTPVNKKDKKHYFNNTKGLAEEERGKKGKTIQGRVLSIYADPKY